jgi:hypothetical protein
MLEIDHPSRQSEHTCEVRRLKGLVVMACRKTPKTS